MVPSCLPVRFDVRSLKALVGPRKFSFLMTAFLLAVGTVTFILADPQDLSFIDSLCRLTFNSNPSPHSRGSDADIAQMHAGAQRVRVRIRVRVRVRVRIIRLGLGLGLGL